MCYEWLSELLDSEILMRCTKRCEKLNVQSDGVLCDFLIINQSIFEHDSEYFDREAAEK